MPFLTKLCINNVHCFKMASPFCISLGRKSRFSRIWAKYPENEFGCGSFRRIVTPVLFKIKLAYGPKLYRWYVKTYQIIKVFITWSNGYKSIPSRMSGVLIVTAGGPNILVGRKYIGRKVRSENDSPWRTWPVAGLRRWGFIVCLEPFRIVLFSLCGIVETSLHVGGSNQNLTNLQKRTNDN